jgi:hypothetical protein
MRRGSHVMVIVSGGGEGLLRVRVLLLLGILSAIIAHNVSRGVCSTHGSISRMRVVLLGVWQVHATGYRVSVRRGNRIRIRRVM